MYQGREFDKKKKNTMSYSLQQVVVAQLRRIQRLSNINDAIYSLVQKQVQKIKKRYI
jgi:hypothetical protein